MIKPIVDSIVHLLFPHTCSGCGSDLLANEALLCIRCFDHLYETDFATIENNAVEKTLWGRVPLTAAMSLYYFSRGSLLQSLVHQFKYKGNKQLGIYLGKQMGYSIKNSERFATIDGIVPVPLFADKEQKRGYNQSALLADGIAAVLQVPVFNRAVTRVRYTSSQTQKTRIQRWQNVEGVFTVCDSTLVNKNILLVDDVITTGATLEACAAAVIDDVPGVSVSIATLAYAVVS